MKISNIILFFAASSFTMSASPAPNSHAASIACDFFKSVSGRNAMATGIDLSSNPDCMAFNMSGGGFVIVSVVDDDNPVIGYNIVGQLSRQTVSPTLVALLDNYKKPVSGLKKDRREKALADRPSEVAPLLGDIAWAQNYPFNILTPEIDGCHCPTGCVATGMAQVMRYYKYPERGTGENSYRWNDRTLSVDFSKSIYDWDLMSPVYNMIPSGDAPTAGESAVATLMRDAGYSVDMQYGPEQSGGGDALVALVEHFGYDRSVRGLWKRDVKDAVYKDVIRGEIAQGRPVFFSSGMHFYICDGYDANGMFHFNYGWGGDGNGFFDVDAFSPDDLETSIQYGVQPDKGGMAVHTGASKRGFVWNGSSFSLNCTLYTCAPDLNCSIGLAYRNASTQQIVYPQQSVSICGSVVDMNMSMNDAGDLEDGVYDIFPVYRDENSYEWCEFYFADGAQDLVRLDIKGGVRLYSNIAPAGKVYVGNLVYTVSEDHGTASLTSFLTTSGSYGLNIFEIPAFVEYNGEKYPVTSIGRQALESHPGQLDLLIGENVESIEEMAFTYVEFENLRFANASKLATIGSNSFVNTQFNSDIILPEGLKEIKWYAFGGASVRKIDIPASVQSIEDLGLYVNGLKDIYVHWDSPLVCDQIFGWKDQPDFLATSTSKVTLHVPSGLKQLYEAAYPWNLVADIVDDAPSAGIGDEVIGDEEVTTVTVYNMQGILLLDHVERSRLGELPSGIYIVNGRRIRL